MWKSTHKKRQSDWKKYSDSLSLFPPHPLSPSLSHTHAHLHSLAQIGSGRAIQRGIQTTTRRHATAQRAFVVLWQFYSISRRYKPPFRHAHAWETRNDSRYAGRLQRKAAFGWYMLINTHTRSYAHTYIPNHAHTHTHAVMYTHKQPHLGDFSDCKWLFLDIYIYFFFLDLHWYEALMATM